MQALSAGGKRSHVCLEFKIDRCIFQIAVIAGISIGVLIAVFLLVAIVLIVVIVVVVDRFDNGETFYNHMLCFKSIIWKTERRKIDYTN